MTSVSARICTGAIIAILHAAACGSPPSYPEIAIEAIDPAAGPEGQSAPVEIRGSGFQLHYDVDLDEDNWALGTATVELGSVALEDILLRGESLLEGVVPGSLPAGVYDVVVSFSDGRSGRLEAGYRVEGSGCTEDFECEDEDPCTTSERCDQRQCVVGERDKDADEDGFVDVACGGDDCDDDTLACGAGCFPGNPAADVCDGLNQDCDGDTDEDATCGDGDCCVAAGQDASSCPEDCASMILDDPFGDGTAFTYVAALAGQVYFGPSADGATAVRADPDGSSPETVALTFPRDTTGNASNNTAAPPYTSIGSTGCTANTLACGPDNEDGRGFFASGVLAGTEWLVVGGARSAGDLDYVYATSSSGAPLSFRYVDLSELLGPQTRGFSAFHLFGDRVYMGFPDSGGARPYLVALLGAPPAPGLDATAGSDAVNLRADDMPGLRTQNNAIIDSIADFNNRVYVANSGGWVRSTTEAPGPADSAPGDWVSHLPSAAAFGAKTSVATTETADLEPVDKAVPQMAVFGGRLYAARNTEDGPQLWACNPSSSDDPLHCDSDDWGFVAANTVGDTQLSQFDNPANTAISLLVATADHLYIGFDNSVSGAVIFRSTVAVPLSRSDFEGDDNCSAAAHPATCSGLGGNGLGDSTNTRILFGIALTFGSDDSVYVAVGSGADAVRIHRLL